MEALLEWRLTLDDVIENIEALYQNKALVAIQEVTYAYSKTDSWKFNVTLFKDFAWLDETSSNWELITKTKQALSFKIREINSIISDLNWVWTQSEEENLKVEFLINALEYTRSLLELASVWVEFEIEKIWKTPELLTWENREKAFNKVSELDEKIFWWKIIDNPNEVTACMDYLASFWNEFSFDDKMFFRWIVTEINNQLWVKFDLEKICKDQCEVEEEKTEKQLKQEEILSKEINQEDYLKIFELVLQIYGLEDDFEIRTSSNRSSIYDWPDFLEFPTSDKYKKLPLKRILELIAHEIERHMLNLKANKENIWKVEWADKLGLEEWMAILMEKIVWGENLEEIWVSKVFPRILFLELFQKDEAFDIINTLWKYDNWIWDENRLYRSKRNYPMDKIWTQHKDTSYTRGISQIIKYIKSWKKIQDLFLGRIWFQDIDRIKNIPYNKYYYPVFVAEAIKYILFETDRYWIWEKKEGCIDFLEYLKERYPFVDLDEKYRCLIQDSWKKINKKIIEILDIIWIEKKTSN